MIVACLAASPASRSTVKSRSLWRWTTGTRVVRNFLRHAYSAAEIACPDTGRRLKARVAYVIIMLRGRKSDLPIWARVAHEAGYDSGNDGQDWDEEDAGENLEAGSASGQSWEVGPPRGTSGHTNGDEQEEEGEGESNTNGEKSDDDEELNEEARRGSDQVSVVAASRASSPVPAPSAVVVNASRSAALDVPLWRQGPPRGVKREKNPTPDAARSTASAGDCVDLIREGSAPLVVLGLSSADRLYDVEVNLWFGLQRAFVRSQWPDQPPPSQVYSTVAGPNHESSGPTPDAGNALDSAGLSQAMSSSADLETEGPPAVHAEGTTTYADDLWPARENVSPTAALSFEACQRFPLARETSDAAVSSETLSVWSLRATDGPQAAPDERPSPSSDDLWYITPAEVESIIESETEAFERYLRAALPSYLHRGPSGSLAAPPILGMSLRDSLIYSVGEVRRDVLRAQISTYQDMEAGLSRNLEMMRRGVPGEVARQEEDHYGDAIARERPAQDVGVNVEGAPQ